MAVQHLLRDLVQSSSG